MLELPDNGQFHLWQAMSEAPKVCLYCDGRGNSDAGGACGFCENGKPLDTQADWDASLGRIIDGNKGLTAG